MASASISHEQRGASPAVRRVVGQVWRSGIALDRPRALAEEVPVAVSYGGTTQAVLMATPNDLEDFAFGFSCTEGIIRTIADVADLTVVHAEDGVELRIWLTNAPSDAFAARRRRQVGATGCGMCGLESLAEANRSLPSVDSGLRVSCWQIEEAVAALPQGQTLNAVTRAVHAAAFWQNGKVLLVREDVGRHNALDKLAGALVRRGWSATGGMIVMSSRISIELVQKASMIAAPVLVAVSAPTAYAIRAAEAAGVTLVGIARTDGFEVFTHPERITD